ncbi:Metallo-hydrolase/oxidoreductase [Hymenopellis radicata]|nr:Metallo-hydrolase/oxidoreductase [Hymenopellis radicata]
MLRSHLHQMLSVTFLGTSSGGGPTTARNCSSLLADIQGNGKLWMVDCAEGTLRQFALQPTDAQRAKSTSVEKIFITHMHADHVMGLVTLLRSLLYPVPNPVLPPRPEKLLPTIEIYGPAGIRNFVRMNMKMTFSKSADKYVVHELLSPSDAVTGCADDERHQSEAPGTDIRADETGFWRSFASGQLSTVDAGPICHRDPCLAYVFRRSPSAGSPPSRSIAILGDTYDPSYITPLLDSPPDLLIHEATDAFIPPYIDPRASRSVEAVQQAAHFRGHSTPDQAGAFARQVGAKRLILNHIGSRFTLPSSDQSERVFQIRQAVMLEIERQASEAWGMGRAKTARDFMRVDIPLRDEHYGADEYPTSSNTYHETSQHHSYSSRPHRGRDSNHEQRRHHHSHAQTKTHGRQHEHSRRREREQKSKSPRR